MYSKLHITQDDLLPYVRKTLTANDTPLVLTGVIDVRFSMREVNSTTRKVDNQQCIIIEVGAVNIGVVEYRWQAGDTDTRGIYVAKFRITYTGTPQKPLSAPGENNMFIFVNPAP